MIARAWEIMLLETGSCAIVVTKARVCPVYGFPAAPLLLKRHTPNKYRHANKCWAIASVTVNRLAVELCEPSLGTLPFDISDERHDGPSVDLLETVDNSNDNQNLASVIVDRWIVDQREPASDKPVETNTSVKNAKLSNESLKKIASAIERNSSLQAIEKTMSSHRLLCLEDLNTILSCLSRDEAALDFFHWMQTKGKTRKNTAAHNSIIQVLGKRREWAAIEGLFNEMVNLRGCTAKCSTYNALIYAACAAHLVEMATKWFKRMLKSGVKPNRATFEMLMTIYQKHRRIKEAEMAVQTLQQQNGWIFCKPYTVLIGMYLYAGKYDMAEKTITEMRNRGVTPDKENWIMQLQVFVLQSKAFEAEQVLQSMLASRIRTDALPYNLVISVLGKMNYFEKALGWFYKLKDAGVKPNQITYRSMIGACGRKGELGTALLLYSEMKGLGFHPSTSNFSTLISLHRKISVCNEDRILGILSHMKVIGGSPDFSTFHALMKIYSRSERLEDISKALALIQEAGWTPSTPKCYGGLIQIYLKLKLVKQAFDTFKISCSLHFKMEEGVCHSLICSCKGIGMYKEAVFVYAEMYKAGIVPGVKCLCTMIAVYSELHRVGEGEKLFQKLRESGKEFDSVAYTIVINMYSKAGMYQKAVEIVKSIEEQRGFRPDTGLFLGMLSVYHECGMDIKAAEVYWRMLEDTELIWTEVLLCSVIKACAHSLPLKELVKLCDRLVDMGFPPDTLTSNIMISIYSKEGMVDKAQAVFLEAKKRGLVDQVSYSTLISAYGKRKEYSKMEHYYWEMQNSGMRASLGVYNAMLDAFGKAGEMGKVREVLQRMHRLGCMPGLTTFNILINVYGKRGYINEVEDTLAEMEEAGLRPDSYTYNTLISAYGIAEMPDAAVKVFKEMQDMGFEPNRVTYINLVTCFERNNNYLEAARWSLWIKQNYQNSVNS